MIANKETLNSLRWYVARTKPQCEEGATRALRNIGLEAFAPKLYRRRPMGGQTRPTFPGYVFVRCNLETDRMNMYRKVPQIINLVHFGRVVPPLSDEAVEQLLIRANHLEEFKAAPGHLTPGSNVQVIHGNIDCPAIVVRDREKANGHVQVLIEFLGRHVHAEVPSAHVWPARQKDEWAGDNLSVRRTRGKGRWIRGWGPRVSERSPSFQRGT